MQYIFLRLDTFVSNDKINRCILSVLIFTVKNYLYFMDQENIK